uniref:Uncharacterized protein n=1 Tax=Noctiluca scintillans TaxID=2966 RepID=A0A7S1F5R1_NOCSC|mmetsp:Transcript_34290/g.91615  ORF Transcript_34290/g.91615 Transcript_34290/m.91615 type:complete len:377 (+) Transcript_34290:79-1209(+)
MDPSALMASGAVPSSVLCCIVVGLSLLRVIVPLLDEALALIPHHTVFSPMPSFPLPFVWNLLTAHFFENHWLKAALVAPWVVALARMLEKFWSLRSFWAHICFTVTSSSIVVFFVQVGRVHYFEEVRPFFAPICGCSGLVVALAVGLRHAYPFEALPLLPRAWGLQCQHLPFALAAVFTVLGLLIPASIPEWPFPPLALFFGWVHLRYVMWFQYAQAYGDHSPEFLFAAMFPRPLRPLVSIIGSLAHNVASCIMPNYIKLRDVDGMLGQMLLYDPVQARSSELGGVSPPEQAVGVNTKEYDARRAKALALLDDNIASLLAPGARRAPIAPPPKAEKKKTAEELVMEVLREDSVDLGNVLETPLGDVDPQFLDEKNL